MPIQRTTIDLSDYPNLVVIYLGLRVNGLRGLGKLIGLGPEIENAVAAKPDGLLLHERIYYGFFPPHIGMRQYWRDFESLETWARSLPHQKWWVDFLKDAGGVGFWHETYFMRGGMEAIYDNVEASFGFPAFAPHQPAKGPMFSARKRLGLSGEAKLPEPAAEDTYNQ